MTVPEKLKKKWRGDVEQRESASRSYQHWYFFGFFESLTSHLREDLEVSWQEWNEKVEL